MGLLEGFWACVAQRRVASLAIVPHLNVLEDVAASFRSCVEHPINAFTLERREEALHHGVS